MMMMLLSPTISSYSSVRGFLAAAAIQLLIITTTTKTHAAIIIGTYDVVDEITKWNTDISQQDRDTKFCKMSANPFVFFRGTNHLFWHTYANDERLDVFGNEIDDDTLRSKTSTWIQGDLHPENFGSFTNDQDDVIYSINDYDESVVADYQYDLWHMAIAIKLWMETTLDETNVELQEEVIDAFVESYLDAMDYFRGINDERDIIFTADDNTYGKLDNFLRDVEDDESRKKMLNKWSTKDNDDEDVRIRRFDLDNNAEKLQAVDAATEEAIRKAFPKYVFTTSLRDEGFGVGDYFDIKGIAKRINAGTGSLGRERYYILIEGPSADRQNDDVILDMKLQTSPTPLAYLGTNAKSDYTNDFGTNHARRHEIAYKALIDEADNHLGWIQISTGDGDGDDNNNNDATKYFSIRERSPYKETFDASLLEDEDDLIELAEQWGSIVATVHARADKDTHDGTYVTKSVDKQIDERTEGQHEEFRQLVREIAFEYAEQVQSDYETFRTSNLLPKECSTLTQQ